jgi:hypothetical protein
MRAAGFRPGSVVLIAALALAFAAPARLDGVECAALSLHYAKKHADLMFSGTVTSVQPLTVGRVIVNLDVDQVWKGRLRRATTIYIYGDSIEAEPFVKGRRYLVIAPKYLLLEFLDKKRDALEPPPPEGSCGWGKAYESVEHELAALGRPRKPR